MREVTRAKLLELKKAVSKKQTWEQRAFFALAEAMLEMIDRQEFNEKPKQEVPHQALHTPGVQETQELLERQSHGVAREIPKGAREMLNRLKGGME